MAIAGRVLDQIILMIILGIMEVFEHFQLSEENRMLIPFNFEIAFQLIDDALDFADENETGKPSAGDLLEGKFTPPLMLYAADLPQAKADYFLCRFKEGSFTQEERMDIARDIRKRGFDAATRELAGEYLAKAAACLDGLPAGPEKDVFLEALEYIRERKK